MKHDNFDGKHSGTGLQFFLEYGRIYSEKMERTKVYVTGGYRSVKGMIRAVQEVDGIGLARPLCQ